MMNRREFLQVTALAAAATGAGCASPFKSAGAFKLPVKPEGIHSVLLHLGYNMWCDWYPEGFDTSAVKDGLPDKKLRCRDDYWRRLADHVAARGLNQIVVDVGEGIVYPSHPELAVEGSWSAEKLADEINRLNAMGIEVIPKLNFATTHSGWMKEYRRMVGTPAYYRFCEDVLRDLYDVFGKPRFIHLGCDEEDNEYHVMRSKKRQYILVRRGEVWKHDFLHLVHTVERIGARPWIWCDYGWDDPTFLKWCPKSVLMSNWFYDEAYGGFDIEKNQTADRKILQMYYDLEKAGFDQLPCGTNWSGWRRRQLKCGADDVIGKLVKLGRKVISDKHLYGFMMAPWASPDTEEHVKFCLNGIDLFADALKQS